MSIIEKTVNKSEILEQQGGTNNSEVSLETLSFQNVDDDIPVSEQSESVLEKAVNKSFQTVQRQIDEIDFPSQMSPNSEASQASQPMLAVNENTQKFKDIGSGQQERVEIDWVRLAELGFVTPSDVNTKTIEEYRNIKRPLVYNAFGTGSVGIERSNLILVTSSIPGEGKTFTAINLALSIANERDKKVLLIDADVARPSIAKHLGIISS